jgi:hypothetical protein
MFLNAIRAVTVATLLLLTRLAAAAEPPTPVAAEPEESSMSMSLAVDASLYLPGVQVGFRYKNLELTVGANWLVVFSSLDVGAKLLWPTPTEVTPYVYGRTGRYYETDVDHHSRSDALSAGVGGEWRFGEARRGFVFGEVGYQTRLPDERYHEQEHWVDVRVGVGFRL